MSIVDVTLRSLALRGTDPPPQPPPQPPPDPRERVEQLRKMLGETRAPSPPVNTDR